VHSVRHTILVTCILTCQGPAALVLAQSGHATLVSLSSVDKVEENDPIKDESNDAEHFLSYSLQASPAHLSLAKLAVERGNSEEILDFGRTMIQEEEELVKKVKVLAAKRGIYPPFRLDASELNDFKNLQSDPPTEFDKSFVECAIPVLEKEIIQLRRATECECRWVRMLASEHLPLVENQLAQLRFIKEKSTKHD